MKFIKLLMLVMGIAAFTSCASGYRPVSPQSLNYVSTNVNDGVTLQYKYDLLQKKYEKKETKKGIKLVAVSVTNNSDKDLIFGKDLVLNYENGNDVYMMDKENIYTTVKQKPATHLLYLLLSPLNLYVTTTNSYGQTTSSSSFPIGLILGPGLTAGNLLTASSANKKFKNDLALYDLQGVLIKKGETRHGLIGIKSDTYEALMPVVKNFSEKDTTEEIAP